ncbi:MAG: hypothetical protein P1V13_22355 [Rhizobiaceae bacterium]|nr:hypothetical protein [Rhizobiaceae bacterium]
MLEWTCVMSVPPRAFDVAPSSVVGDDPEAISADRKRDNGHATAALVWFREQRKSLEIWKMFSWFVFLDAFAATIDCHELPPPFRMFSGGVNIVKGGVFSWRFG